MAPSLWQGIDAELGIPSHGGSAMVLTMTYVQHEAHSKVFIVRIHLYTTCSYQRPSPLRLDVIRWSPCGNSNLVPTTEH